MQECGPPTTADKEGVLFQLQESRRAGPAAKDVSTGLLAPVNNTGTASRINYSSGLSCGRIRLGLVRTRPSGGSE